MKPPVDDAGVEAPAAVDVDAEVVEGGVQLVAAPAHEPGPGPGDDDRPRRCHQPGRLVGRRAADQDPAGGDRRLGLLPAGDQAPAHELGVEPAPDARG